MIVSLNEAKQYLRVDGEYDDQIIVSLISAAEEYITNATGVKFNSSNNLARLLCLVLITDWYENRMQSDKISEKFRFTVQSLLAQLKYGQETEDTNDAG